ncbi:hypothetical protein ACIQHY_27510 [Streptomyces sp. NPDC092359]|uniref:hypothetical protein n=1 Tax=Streptomyces sp. NPDC092359 TaxID=3366014 RepID=UPI00380E0D9F
MGRRTELDDVSAALAEHRLVTVTGAGGVGKTRFAPRAAHRAAARHPDGACWTDLGQLDGDRLLAPLVADSVDLADRTTGTATGLRHGLADARLLLVLDSCEHLTGACALLVTELLAAPARPAGTAGAAREAHRHRPCDPRRARLRGDLRPRAHRPPAGRPRPRPARPPAHLSP